MMNISERAHKYADGKANEVITEILAQAYIDGYRDGYKDREEEIPVDLRDNKTEYVDLGLPSGTLWAKDYEMENGKILYLPYDLATRLQLPTVEQWKELYETCVWRPNYYDRSIAFESIDCIGPNGTIVRFPITGHIEVDKTNHYHCSFWIVSSKDQDNEVNMIDIFNPQNNSRDFKIMIGSRFTGFKLPVRQVR